MATYLNYLLITCQLLTFKFETTSSQRYFGTTSFLRSPEVRAGVALPPELWFTQILDHFNPADSRVWKQKYFVNDDFYEEGGPIFLKIGGEVPASAAWMVNGSWVTYGMKYKALLVQLEHRFYGDSRPTPDLTVENLSYLSSEQALADLAYFTTKFKEERNLTSSKVIAFGGSYAGSLAVWFRLKYPHVVHGSVSSSAPLLAHINFKEYLDVATSTIEDKGGKLCVKQIKDATRDIDHHLRSEGGRRKLEKLFRLCSSLDGRNKNDVSNFFYILLHPFTSAVQYYNNDKKNIGTICNIMTNESYNNALQRYAAVNSYNLERTKNKCRNHTYVPFINELRKSEYITARSWIYQTCTEFGFFVTSDSCNQPFGLIFPLSFYLQWCKDIFGEKFDVGLLQRGVERTNIMYGGKNPKVTRVVLVNGSLDPWHYLGVLQDLNDEAKAIFINGTAHGADFLPADSSDSIQLKAARKRIIDLIGKWLRED